MLAMPDNLRVIGAPELLFHIHPPITFQGIVPHTHWAYEIAYFTRGAGKLIYNGGEIEASMPLLHFCPPRPAWHGFVAKKSFTTASMTIHPELLGGSEFTLAKAPQPVRLLEDLARRPTPVVRLSQSAMMRVEQIIRLLCEEYRLQLDAYLMRVASLVQELLVLASREEQGLHIHPTESHVGAGESGSEADAAAAGASRMDPRVSKALDLIRRNAQNPIDNASLARQCGLREKYFIRTFTREVGISPQRYYLRVRLEASAQFLTNASYNIETVAHQFGFRHRSHFQTAFRQYFKMTPSQYQYIHRGGDSGDKRSKK